MPYIKSHKMVGSPTFLCTYAFGKLWWLNMVDHHVSYRYIYIYTYIYICAYIYILSYYNRDFLISYSQPDPFTGASEVFVAWCPEMHCSPVPRRRVRVPLQPRPRRQGRPRRGFPLRRRDRWRHRWGKALFPSAPEQSATPDRDFCLENWRDMLNTLKCNDFIWHKWHKKDVHL